MDKPLQAEAYAAANFDAAHSEATEVDPESSMAAADSVLGFQSERVIADPRFDSIPDLMAELELGTELTSPIAAQAIGVALSGRELGMKQALLDAYGGTAATEAAVLLGLKWLAAQQDKKTGHWSLQGPYPDGSRDQNHEAATAMALLAFQGAGHTHQASSNSPFAPVVRRGWNALLRKQQADGNFFRATSYIHRLYTQAQCTIALCELLAMTRDESFREPAQRAVDFCVRAQAPQGGWRYDVATDSDTSVTGWFVMALQSARMAGLVVPTDTLEGVRRFLNRVATDGGRRYAYQPGQPPRLSMTAEGLLCRQYLGWQRDDPRLEAGTQFLLANLPDWEDRDVYYWYYATQVCHHMEGAAWREWNEVMRQILPENQIKEGRQRGSWDPTDDRWGEFGGRLYVTCLSIYILEVYYRHLPLYRQIGPHVGL